MAETLRTTKISMIVKTTCKTWDQKSQPNWLHQISIIHSVLHLSSCKFTIDHITPLIDTQNDAMFERKYFGTKAHHLGIYVSFRGCSQYEPWMNVTFPKSRPPNQSDQQLLAVQKLKQGILQGLQGTEIFWNRGLRLKFESPRSDSLKKENLQMFNP